MPAYSFADSVDASEDESEYEADGFDEIVHELKTPVDDEEKRHKEEVAGKEKARE